MEVASYFRKFIPEFASCIMKLTKEMKNLFGDKNKQLQKVTGAYLSKQPFLLVFDPDLETELHTDASSIGYGEILLERQENQLKVVAYFLNDQPMLKVSIILTILRLCQNFML